MINPRITVEELHDHAARLAGERYKHERLLVAALLADPATAVDVAEDAGATPNLFADEELRIFYLACCVARNHPVERILRVALAALDRNGFTWNANQAVDLALYHVPSHTAVRAYVRNLREIDEREREAEQLFSRAVELLAGNAAPAAISLSRRPLIVLSPRVAKGASR